MLKVSVIVPVYNAEKYLRDMLDSVCGQTLQDIEIICVDDGSDDASMQILEEYAAKDGRIKILRQENSGAGIARNRGIEIAKGKYLSILDADDFFERDMLELAYAACERDKADICVFRSARYDTKTGQYEDIPWTIQKRFLPDKIPFAPRDIYHCAFQIFNGWSWDKVYRRDMVEKSGLWFQGLRTTNDAFFVFLMNLEADRITVIDKKLAYHRANVKTSLSVTREKSWECCWQAASAICTELKARGQYDLTERSFVNWALHFLLWNVHSLKDKKAKKNLYCKMRKEYFPALGMDRYPENYFYNQSEYQEYKSICQPDGIKKTLRLFYIRVKRKLF